MGCSEPRRSRSDADQPELEDLETLWALTTEEEAEFFKFFDQYEADLWHELNQSAEAQGHDPLELLNSWSDDQGITITSAESMKKQLLRWTMEKICRSRALAWGQ